MARQTRTHNWEYGESEKVACRNTAACEGGDGVIIETIGAVIFIVLWLCGALKKET